MITRDGAVTQEDEDKFNQFISDGNAAVWAL